MSKVILTDLSSLQNEQSAVSSINNNNTTIEQAFDNTLSRNGSSPNTMEASLDMNSNRILNLPDPSSDKEPVTRSYFDAYIGAITPDTPLPSDVFFKSLDDSDDITEGSTKLLMTVAEREQLSRLLVTPEDYGAYDWASVVLAADAVTGAILLRGGAMSASVAATDVDTLFEILPRLQIAPGSSLAVTVGAGVEDCDTALLLNGPDLSNVTITGASAIAVTISGVNSVSSATFNVTHWDGVARDLNYHEVEYNVDTVSGVSAGQFLIVSSTAAATDHELHRGAWEIIDVDAANTRITVLHTGHTAPPSTSFTGAGSVLPTVIRFLDGSTKGFSAMTAENGSGLGTVNRIAFVGTGRPVVDGDRGPTGYDVPGGSGGVTGIIARDNGTLEFGSQFVVSGFSGTNAGSNRSGTIVTTGYSCNAARNGWSGAVTSAIQAQAAVAAGNLIDGFISQDTSYNFCSSSISVGNHRHGYISSNNSSLNAGSTKSKGNRSDGYNVLLSVANLIGASAVENGGYAVDAVNGAEIRATSFAASGNDTGGVFCDGGSTFEGSGANVSGNTGFDYKATNGGYISIPSHVTSGSPTYSPALNKTDSTGALIRSDTDEVLPLNAWHVVASSGAEVSHTGDTSETTLDSVDIPAIGPNGKIKIEHAWTFTGTNSKVPRIKLSGTGGGTYYAPTVTTNLSAGTFTIISAANSESAQKGHCAATVVGGVGGSGAALPTTTVDLSGGGTITFTGQLTDTGESIAISSYAVSVCYGA